MLRSLTLLAAALLAGAAAPAPAHRQDPWPELKKLEYFLGDWSQEGDVKAGYRVSGCGELRSPAQPGAAGPTFRQPWLAMARGHESQSPAETHARGPATWLHRMDARPAERQ